MTRQDRETLRDPFHPRLEGWMAPVFGSTPFCDNTMDRPRNLFARSVFKQHVQPLITTENLNPKAFWMKWSLVAPQERQAPQQVDLEVP